MPRCPNGHTTELTDFCDICGLPVETTGSQAAAEIAPEAAPQPDQASPAPVSCPACGTVNVPQALFCEACGQDFFTTVSGQPPSHQVVQPAPGSAIIPPAPVVSWVAELWIDPDWYAAQGSTDPLPSPGLPDIVPLVKDSNLIGRVSVSRNIYPEIDCELDTGCSRRHARLSTDGERWWIEDLESANGTFLASAAGPLPAMPIPRGRVEIASDQRIYLGAWTRIVVRRATVDEQEAFAGQAG